MRADSSRPETNVSPFSKCVVLLLILAVNRAPALADSWPTYLGNNGRTGVSGEKLELPLKAAWVFSAQHPPAPSFERSGYGRFRPRGKPDKRGFPPFTHDRAFQVVVGGGKAYFGSSTEEILYCLRADTGEVVWAFYAEGAIRLAPTLAGGRVYFGSDDGYAYCLDAESGSLLWKFRAGPGERRVIINGRISSQWPVRTSITVDGGTAYFGAGLFPGEDRGALLNAVDALSGEPVWQQKLNIPPIGHIFASQDTLMVPTGRTAPKEYRRSDGTPFFPLFLKRRHLGGGSPFLVGDMLAYGPNERGLLTVQATEEEAKYQKTWQAEQARTWAIPGGLTAIKGRRLLSDESSIYVLRSHEIWAIKKAQAKEALQRAALDRIERAKKTYLGSAQDDPLLLKDLEACMRWKAKLDAEGLAMLMAGGLLAVGTPDGVAAFDAASGEARWSEKVDGTAWDIAVAEEALYVSTDKGKVYCFSGADGVPAQPRDIRYPAPALTPAAGAADVGANMARMALAATDDRKGYCLVLGAHNVNLVSEIARSSEFMIVVAETDEEEVRACRELLSATGLYGRRVTVHHVAGDTLPYLSFFANLVVADASPGHLPYTSQEAWRTLRPAGGLMAVFGNAAGNALAQWDEAIPNWELKGETPFAFRIARRGPIEGAGEWTHIYADVGNTSCSGDTLAVGTAFELQWVGMPGVQRQLGSWHAHSMPPLCKDGRLFVLRNNYVIAVDAYNGTILWERDVPDSSRLDVAHESGQACVDEDHLYIASKNTCWALNVRTGDRVKTFAGPNDADDWGYLAVHGDILFGTNQNRRATLRGVTHRGLTARNTFGEPGNVQVVSNVLFALDKKDGKSLWEYRATGTVILNTGIAIGDGRIILIESSSKGAVESALGVISLKDDFMPDARLVALDVRTGRKAWERPLKVSAEEILRLSYDQGKLIVTYTWNGQQEDIEFAGKKWRSVRYGLLAIDALSARDVWAQEFVGARYNFAHNVNLQHPCILGDKVYIKIRTNARLQDIDLHTGKIQHHPGIQSGKGCGALSGSARNLFYRDGPTSTYDTVARKRVYASTVTRPSCWISVIPAAGLVLMPESSVGCECGFPMQTSVVLVPKPRQ